MTEPSNYAEDPYYGDDVSTWDCPSCHGTGVERFTDDPCPECYGEGYLPGQKFTRIRVFDQASGDDVP